MASCSVCGKDNRDMIHSKRVYHPIAKMLAESADEWHEDSMVCTLCHASHRSDYIQGIVEDADGKIIRLEEELNKAINDEEILSINVESEMKESRSFPERISDWIADFAGSWTFIIIFFVFLFGWMAFNILMVSHIIDPYPFILLNLWLSCLAAIQAPLILMSQKSQESRDRAKAENDYLINLKSELEVRHLNKKVDAILESWQRFLRLQILQTDMLHEIANRRKDKEVDTN